MALGLDYRFVEPGAAPARWSTAKPTLGRLLLAALLSNCHPRLAAHHRRVSAMSALLAAHLGLGEAQAAAVGRAGALHDIGMAVLPEELLEQHGLLSAKEKTLIHEHSAWGHEILELTQDPDLRLAARVALEHHERWDGSGYPHGLRGEEICLAARIVAICAVYDALRNPRPGRRPLGHAAALAVLRCGDAQSRATAFDPAVRKVFVAFQDDFRCIAEEVGHLALAA